MKWMKKRWVKKLFLLAFLAIAGIVIGEVVGYMTRQSAEDILLELKAKKIIARRLNVNGHDLLAEVWQLPPTSSSDPLKKASDKLLVVKKTVFLFKDDIGSSKGLCDYPIDLPACDLQCDYVIQTGNMRFVIGTTTSSRANFLEAFGQSAQAMGWTSELPADKAFLWTREEMLLELQTVEFPNRGITQVALLETRVQ